MAEEEADPAAVAVSADDKMILLDISLKKIQDTQVIYEKYLEDLTKKREQYLKQWQTTESRLADVKKILRTPIALRTVGSVQLADYHRQVEDLEKEACRWKELWNQSNQYSDYANSVIHALEVRYNKIINERIRLESGVNFGRVAAEEVFSFDIAETSTGSEAQPPPDFRQILMLILRRVNGLYPVMRNLDAKLNNRIPRRILIVPSGLHAKRWTPKRWLHRMNPRGIFKKTAYVYFVCPITSVIVKPPIKIPITRGWFKRAAPVIAFGLILVRVGCGALAHVDLPVDDVVKELSQDLMKEMVNLVKDQIEDESTQELLARVERICEAGGNITKTDIRLLNNFQMDEFIVAAENDIRWRDNDNMIQVHAKESAVTMWVSGDAMKDEAVSSKYAVLSSTQ